MPSGTGGPAGRFVRLRVGDRVRLHFQNRYGGKSSGTDVGTLLQFTTEEAEVHFDDGAVQRVNKTWIMERLAPWDLDLQFGDIVHAHYASGKGRTSGTDLGIVLAVLEGGRIRIRFQDDITQTIPMGWVEQVMRLQSGDRVMSYFKVNDGRGAKSLKPDVATVLHVSRDEVHLVYDDRVEQNVLKTWVAQRVRTWDLTVDIGTVADVHFEVGEDGRRSVSTDIGVIVANGNPAEGRVAIQFQDGVRQSVPLGWIARIREWAAGDRVQSHFKTGGGLRSNSTDVCTVLSTSLLEVELYFDDGVQQCVSKAWVTDRIRDWSKEVPELAVGDVVAAHFKCPGNQGRSVQTDRGIILSVLPKGQVSIKFQDDITQVIPKGWIESVAIRWTGQRDELSWEWEEADANSRNAGLKEDPRQGIAPASGQPECVICMDARPNGVIVHGELCHQSTCYSCAKKLQRNGDPCPICREPIETVCKHHGEIT
jgi:E3 ubiquitin-protein ligase Mdm2